ncbi:hypothetical protein [uncultured Pontibacter sp.]|uniref:hypothetical protein n=1 Tax=uncultured Pontibacter sp. TaxID=453356 RepID=UPI002634BD50|nr:hypothetical protein [uncultured Pontibacter sp.]
MALISCDTPKDQRPSGKASVGEVAPGTRGTYNVSDAGGDVTVHEGHGADKEVMPNHDQGANTIQLGDSIRERAETNTAAGAVKR